MNTEKKIVLITGSESGIGKSAANLMLDRGCTVIGADIRKNPDFVSDNPNYFFIKIDMTFMEEVNSLYEFICKEFGRLDVLLNCAGITSLEGINQITPEKWDNMLSINLKAVFFSCQKALELMTVQKYGKIVNISSNAGIGGGKAVGIHYSASKAGVIGLTKSLALYAADYNVNVNCVAPGPTQTPMTDEWESDVNRKLKELIPLKRFADPEEIAVAIDFLSSEKADFITGATLNVNGGLLMV